MVPIPSFAGRREQSPEKPQIRREKEAVLALGGGEANLNWNVRGWPTPTVHVLVETLAVAMKRDRRPIFERLLILHESETRMLKRPFLGTGTMSSIESAQISGKI